MSDDPLPIPADPSFLSVGLPLRLTIQVGNGKAQYGSTLLGWKEHAWLICEWPPQARQEAGLVRGAKCLVSCLYAGKLVGYRCDVRGTLEEPVPLLFLSFPSTVEEVLLRKHARMPSNEPALLAQMHPVSSAGHPSRADHQGGLLKDLSESGCSILLSHLDPGLRPGARITMEFGLPGVGHVTNLSGIVKNLQEQAPNYLVGIEFLFNRMEFIEFRGWGGTVQQAIKQWVRQKALPVTDGSECLTE